MIAAWSETNPGKWGVFRNAAGITVLTPNNDGLSVDDAGVLIADPIATATFLSEHLMVGVSTSEGLGDEVTTAMGSTCEVVDGTIGGGGCPEADDDGEIVESESVQYDPFVRWDLGRQVIKWEPSKIRCPARFRDPRFPVPC